MGQTKTLLCLLLIAAGIAPASGQQNHSLVVGWSYTLLNRGRDWYYVDESTASYGDQTGSGFQIGYTRFPEASGGPGVIYGALIAVRRSSGTLSLNVREYPNFYNFTGEQQLTFTQLELPFLGSFKATRWMRLNVGCVVRVDLAKNSKEIGTLINRYYDQVDTTYNSDLDNLLPRLNNSVNICVAGGFLMGPWKGLNLDMRALYSLSPVRSANSPADDLRYPFTVQVSLAYDVTGLFQGIAVRKAPGSQR